MLKNGQTLNADGREYTIIEFIGSGATTTAYLAECRHGGLKSRCILKEYTGSSMDYETGKSRFIDSGRLQNKIRQMSVLNNQTPPVSHIFELENHVYMDVSCYNGSTLDRLENLSLLQYMEICRTIAKTVGYYHSSGFLCLDLKPENIFIMQNAPDDTVTQLVEFIDFDSVCEISAEGADRIFSFTEEWSAPEQMNPYSIKKINKSSDIYTMGEIVFYLLFGRHSRKSEHRAFSEYPFDDCRVEYKKFTDRPDIRSLFIKLFRSTIRSSCSNRFGDMDDVVKLLDKIIEEIRQKDYIIPTLPSVSPDFVGRDTEIREISENLMQNRVLFITGVGGIGKSTLIKNYIAKNRTDYDVIVYLEYDGDIRHTFSDDIQLQISTVKRQDDETADEYFTRKFTHFRRICGEKRVLFTVDNYSGRITKDMGRIIDCGYDTVIVTRNRPPKNSFRYIEIGAIANKQDIFGLVELNMGRTLTREESTCFEEIISLVQGHTLVIELVARQTASGGLNVHTALDLIRKNGFSEFSGEKISNYKDGEEVYGTLSTIISALFNSGKMNKDEKLALKILSLLNVYGLDRGLAEKFFPNIQEKAVESLSRNGWIYMDSRLHVHPVIAETVRKWEWEVIQDEVSVMEYHKKVVDIYSGMSDTSSMLTVLREAERYTDTHKRHILRAIYFDMLADYYDTLTQGNYIPYNEEERGVLQKLENSMETAVREMKQSKDKRRDVYLTEYYLSMASIFIRSTPEQHVKAKKFLLRAYSLIKKSTDRESENFCYYMMVSAWYFTLVKPDLDVMKRCTQRAEKTAERVFKTDLEIIDVIYIPTANCLYYHGDFRSAAEKIEKAVEMCKKHPDIVPYIDKRAELLRCLVDIYSEIGDMRRCREFVAEIDVINENYREQGIFREVPPDIRKKFFQ